MSIRNRRFRSAGLRLLSLVMLIGVVALSCPLSPLMGAVFLDVLDRRMEVTGLVYVRFMDDWVILAPTRWKLRKAVRIVNETLAELKVEQHPDKTFIGRVRRGFDFVEYRFTSSGLIGVARQTVKIPFHIGANAFLNLYTFKWKARSRVRQ